MGSLGGEPFSNWELCCWCDWGKVRGDVFRFLSIEEGFHSKTNDNTEQTYKRSGTCIQTDNWRTGIAQARVNHLTRHLYIRL